MLESLIDSLEKTYPSVDSFSLIYSRELGKYIAVIETSGHCTSTISVTHDNPIMALKSALLMLKASQGES